MQSTKLVRILSTFSPKELKGFRKYISTPYFNEQDRLVQLFNIVEECFFVVRSQPSKEFIWQQLFPQKKFNDALLRKLLSDLSKLAEEFLVWQGLQERPVEQANLLLSELNKRKLAKDFNKVMRTIRDFHEDQSYRDDQYYFNAHLIDSELNRFVALQGKRTKDVSLQSAARNLDHYYLITKLRYCCDLLNYKNVIDIEYELLFMEEILKYLKDHDFREVPAIAIYYHILMLLRNENDEQHFETLTNLLEVHDGLFTLEERRGMYTYALNYCIKKANTGDRKFLVSLFKLYQQALDKGILLEDKYLSPWNYKNIVTAGLRVGETAWIQAFIHEYKNSIDKKFRENAFTYNLARYYFQLKDHEEVIALLQQVEYEDIFYNLGAKSMLLKTYYETEEISAMYSLLDSFEIFLRRNKLVSGYHRKNHLNLIRYVRKLIRLHASEKEKITQLEEALKVDEEVSDRKWLMAQLERLKGK